MPHRHTANHFCQILSCWSCLRHRHKNASTVLLCIMAVLCKQIMTVQASATLLPCKHQLPLHANASISFLFSYGANATKHCFLVQKLVQAGSLQCQCFTQTQARAVACALCQLAQHWLKLLLQSALLCLLVSCAALQGLVHHSTVYACHSSLM